MRVSRGYEGGAPWQGMASAQGYLFLAAGNQLIAYRGSQTVLPPSPSPSPSAAPSPDLLRTLPGASPNSTRRSDAPPAPPSCCTAFAPVRQLISRMTMAQFSHADVSGRRGRAPASRLR